MSEPVNYIALEGSSQKHNSDMGRKKCNVCHAYKDSATKRNNNCVICNECWKQSFRKDKDATQ